jgi:hypothetical protein
VNIFHDLQLSSLEESDKHLLVRIIFGDKKSTVWFKAWDEELIKRLETYLKSKGDNISVYTQNGVHVVICYAEDDPVPPRRPNPFPYIEMSGTWGSRGQFDWSIAADISGEITDYRL